MKQRRFGKEEQMDFLMETRDLTKAWRKKTAVERVNLHVREGEI